MKIRLSLATALLCCASLAPLAASADPWKGHSEHHKHAHKEYKAERGHDHDYRPPTHYARNTSYHYYDDDDDDRRYGDRRYYDGDRRYYGRNDWDRVSHYHPGGRHCRDVRHIMHYRDGYYRNGGRWYRDGRYWNEVAYVDRYYRQRQRHRDHDGNDDLYRGIVIGAAIVGVIAAVHEANDGD